MQEKTIRRMIGNWMKKALTQSGIDRVELHRDTCEFYWAGEGIYIIDEPYLVCAVIQTINPEARVNFRSLKDHLKSVSVN